MHKEDAEKKIVDINNREDELQDMQKKRDEYVAALIPLEVEFERVKKIGEHLSSITSSKAKAETE